MASANFDYLATRNDIIASAFRIVGVHSVGQPLPANKLAQGVEALQMLIKSWINKHIFLWSYEVTDFDTVANQERYLEADGVSADIIGVDRAWYVDPSSNEDIPIDVISFRRYLDQWNKETNPSTPCAITFKRGPEPSVYVWPSPNAVFTIKMLSIFALQDFDTAGGSGEIPAEMQRALKYGLAADLFDEYPANVEHMNFVQRKAEILFQEAKNFNTPRESTNEIESLYDYGSRYGSRRY